MEDSLKIRETSQNSGAYRVKVLRSKDGRHGIALTIDEKTDVILCDIMMPWYKWLPDDQRIELLYNAYCVV